MCCMYQPGCHGMHGTLFVCLSQNHEPTGPPLCLTFNPHTPHLLESVLTGVPCDPITPYPALSAKPGQR